MKWSFIYSWSGKGKKFMIKRIENHLRIRNEKWNVSARGCKREKRNENEKFREDGRKVIYTCHGDKWLNRKKYEKIKRWGKKYMTKWKKEKEVKEKILVLTCDTSK